MVNGGKTLYVTRVNPFVNRVNRGVHRPEFYGLGTDPADVAGVGRPPAVFRAGVTPVSLVIAAVSAAVSLAGVDWKGSADNCHLIS